MATITREIKFWYTGGAMPTNAAKRRRLIEELNAYKAKRTNVIRDRYRGLGRAIYATPRVSLADEVCGYMVVPTVQDNLTVRVFHPEEVASLGGEPMWAITFGDFGKDKYVDETYPASMSAVDIAARVNHLVKLVNPITSKRTAKRSQKHITRKLLGHSSTI